jgi:hypothetical protein
MPTLKTQLEALAQKFAADVFEAIRGASLEELFERKPGGPRIPPWQRPGPRPTSKGTRLARRSSDQIAKALDQVVALVKTKKDGLRAEQIRAALKMQSKEMPRVLVEGLSTKKLVSKGQKRATTYFVK